MQISAKLNHTNIRMRDAFLGKIVTLLFNYLRNLILHTFSREARWNILFKLKFQARAPLTRIFSPFTPRQQPEGNSCALRESNSHPVSFEQNNVAMHLPTRGENNFTGEHRKKRRKLFK
jgi:hypothetical protein